MSANITASGSDEALMCYYFDAKTQKNIVITARPMTKHKAVQHAKAANKYYAGRQIVQVCQIPNWTPAESANNVLYNSPAKKDSANSNQIRNLCSKTLKS